MFAIVGVATLFFAHAATPTASIEPENGTLAGQNCVASDSSASAGSAVKFGTSTCGTGAASAPATPAATGAQICGNNAILGGGPTTAPTGAITVPAGDNSSVNFNQSGKTFWFAAGTHTLGTSAYGQIVPGSNSTYIGAPGAIIDGQGLNHSAFDGTATGVTIKYLTIQDFGTRSPNTLTTPSSDMNNEGTVNHDSGHNWTIEYSTVQYNGGAGVFGGTGTTIEYNCLYKNAQYGFSLYEADSSGNDATINNVVIDHNEISTNDTYDWESHIDGCGCTGGGKFWMVNGAAFTNNYVHDNLSDGMWADTNNVGFDVEGNYFSNNEGPAVEYEISYNILIKNNTFVSNAIPAGKANTGFPEGAVYLSESGSDSRVSSPYNTASVITGNVFTNNWAGVVLWENADRFCSSSANTSSGTCTLVNPSVANLTTCASKTSQAPYIDDCRWKTQNVQVNYNTFNMDRSAIGSSCTAANSCGVNAIFSEYGSYAPYTGWPVATHIVNSQNNVFSHNTYTGSWNFMSFNQSDTVTFAQWQAGFDDGNGSGVHVNGQDAGSTLN